MQMFRLLITFDKQENIFIGRNNSNKTSDKEKQKQLSGGVL